MADKGIIFSAAMVRALLDGRKTQTRRLLGPQPKAEAVTARCVAHEKATGRAVFNFFNAAQKPIYAVPVEGGHAGEYRAPYGVGDRLYVREAHAIDGARSWYRLGHEEASARGPRVDVRWRPSIHMPRWASRLWLEVTEVRVQRLHEINDEDARAEGLGDHELYGFDARGWFRDLWDSLHPTKGERWEDNPWIVAVSFTAHRGNIDEVAG